MEDTETNLPADEQPQASKGKPININISEFADLIAPNAEAKKLLNGLSDIFASIAKMIK